jgi:hypothetical protein
MVELLNGVIALTGIDQPKMEIETQGQVPSDAPLIDLTDPSVDPGDFRLSGREQRIRALRRYGRSLQILFDPSNPALTLDQAVKEGQLAPPRSEAEQLTNFLAETTPAFIGGGAAFVGARSVLGASLVRPGLTGAAARFGQSALGRRVAGAATQVGLRGGAATATRGGVAAGEAAGERFAGVLGAEVGAEAITGAGIGAAESARFQAGATGGEIDPGTVVQSALLGIGLGVPLGGGISLFVNSRDFIRNAGRLRSALEGGVFPEEMHVKGFKIGSREVDSVRRDGSIQWRASDDFTAASGKKYKKGQLTSKPSEEEVSSFSRELVEAFRHNREEAETLLGKSTIEKVSTEPGTLEYRTINSLDAQYDPIARRRVESFKGSVEALEEEAAFMEAYAARAPNEEARLTAIATSRALRRALGEEVEALPGTVGLRKERELIRYTQVLPAEEITQLAAQREAMGLAQEATRLRELAQLGVPRAARGQIRTALVDANLAASRGLTKGSALLAEDGTRLEIQQVRFGKASVIPRAADKPATPLGIELAGQTIIPRVGSKVRLTTGQVAEVVEVDTALQQGSFVLADGTRQTLPLANVAGVGDTRYARRLFDRAYKFQQEAEPRVEVEPQRAVLTDSGEPVEVTEMGEKTVKVTSRRTNKEKVVDRAKVTASSKVVRDPEAVPTFEPATVPESGNRLLFLSVPKELESEFEDLIRRGVRDVKLQELIAESGLEPNRPLSVLPTPDDGSSILYGVEVPANLIPRKSYSPQANKALRVMAGKRGAGKLAAYETPVGFPAEAVNAARFSKVPEEVRTAGILDLNQLNSLPPSERAEALLRTSVLDDRIVEAHATTARSAKAAKKAALQQNEVEAVAQVEKNVDDKKQLMKELVDELERSVEEVRVELTSRLAVQDEPGARLTRRVREVGTTVSARKAALRDLAAYPANETPLEEIAYFHPENPELQLVVTRRVAEEAETEFLHPVTNQIIADKRELTILTAREGLRPKQRSTGRTIRREYYEARLHGGTGVWREQFDDIDDFLGFLRESAFAPAPARYYTSFPWLHSQDPDLGATISVLDDGKLRVRVTKLTDTEEGIPQSEISQHVFGSPDEAQAFLDTEGFALRAGADVDEATTIIQSLKDQMPDPAQASRGQLEQHQDALISAVDDLVFERRTFPADLDNYVRSFAKRWVDLDLPGAPLTQSIRRAIGAATPRDLSLGDIGRTITTAPGQRTPGPYFDWYGYEVLHRRRKLGTPQEQAVWDAVREMERSVDEVADILNPEINIRPDIDAHVAEAAEYVEIGSSGRIAKIVDGMPDDPQSMLVEMPGGGTRLISKPKARRLVREWRHEVYWRRIRDVEFGEPAAIPSTPPIGGGEIEKALGLHGIRSKGAVGGRMRRRLEELLKDVRKDKKGTVLMSDDAAEEISHIWKRARELELDNVLSAMPEDMRKFADWAVYRQTYKEHGQHPFADLQARAVLDKLTPDEIKNINRFAGEFGLEGMNVRAQLEELVRQGAIDSRLARQMFELNSEMGFLRFTESAQLPPGSVTIKQFRTPSDLWYGGALDWHIPAKAMNRHPVARGVMANVLKAAQRLQQFMFDDVEPLIGRLLAQYNEKELIKIRRLLNTHDTWEQALRAGAPKEFAEGFIATRDWLDMRRYDVIKESMRRSNQGRLITRDAKGRVTGRDADLLREIGLDPNDLPEDFMIMDRVKRSQGHFSPREIDAFIHHLQQFDNAAELQAAIPDIPMKMLEQFDFWKRWRRANYWPYVHEGHIALEEVLADGTVKAVGYAQTPLDALNLIRHGKKIGKLNVDGQFQIREMKAILDDHTAAVIPWRKYTRIRDAMARAAGMSKEEVSAALVGADALAPGPRAAFLANAERRIVDLEPLIEQPVLELRMYGSRIARSRYRNEILQGIDNWNELDRTVSSAWGIKPLGLGDPLAERVSFGRFGGGLRSMVRDQVRMALGERTWQDTFLDFTLSLGDALQNAPTQMWRRWIKGEEALTLRQLFHDNFGSGRGRAFASRAIAIQSFAKLGVNPSSALVNLTQLITNTAPRIGVYTATGLRDTIALMTDGLNPGARKSLGFTVTGGRKLSRADVQLYNELIEQAGARYLPAKQVAGIGYADWIGDKLPIRAFKKNPVAAGVNWAEYYTMLLFQGAERVNRVATLIGGYRHAREVLKLGDDAARVWAKDLMEQTQFLYTTEALPMFMKGPLARVVFQFKPFLVNQMSFTLDLGRALARREPGALKAMATHVGAYGLFGGMRAVVNHPFLAAFSGLLAINGWPTIEDWVMDRNRVQKDREREDVIFNTRDLLYHGVPGLLGVSTGQRIGVSGQELQADRFLEGPYVSALLDFYRAARKFSATPGTAPNRVGGVAGAFAAGYVPGIGRLPLTRIAGATFGAFLAGKAGAGQDMDLFLQSREGRRLYSTLVPTQLRNIDRTADIIKGVGPRDINFRPLLGPHTGIDRTYAGLAQAVGFELVPLAEQRAGGSVVMARGKRIQNARDFYAEAMARAIIQDDPTAFHQAAIAAANEGIAFSYGDLQDRIERMTVPAIETIRQAQPIEGRF